MTTASPLHPKSRFLLVQLRQLGDTLLATPCIQAIRQALPAAHIGFLSNQMGKKILEDNPLLNATHFYRDNFGVRDELALVRELRRERYDVVPDFWSTARSGLYSYLSGAKTRLSYRTARRFFYTKALTRDRGDLYAALDKQRFLHELGLPSQEMQLLLPWHAKDVLKVEKFLAQNAALEKAKIRIVISPTHRREVRRWPLAKYAELAVSLYRDWQAAIVWLWGPGEEEVVATAMQLAKGIGYKAPATSFREMAALIANCDLFIGNSNGPSHVAVATDTISLQIHGPTLASSWCPMNSRHQAVEIPLAEKAQKSIQDIDLALVRQKLDQMQVAVANAAAARHAQGPRTSW